MLHHLTIGQSLQGKTTLNVELARGLRRRGIRVGVLDILRNPAWPCDLIESNPDKFLAFVLTLGRRKGERWALFIDEGGLSIGRDPRFTMLTTTARHLGVITHLISHRWKTLLPELRDSCGRKWIFNNEDGPLMSRDLGRPELRDCIKLRVGQFFYADPRDLGSTGRGRIEWGKSGKPTVHLDGHAAPKNSRTR